MTRSKKTRWIDDHCLCLVVDRQLVAKSTVSPRCLLICLSIGLHVSDLSHELERLTMVHPSTRAAATVVVLATVLHHVKGGAYVLSPTSRPLLYSAVFQNE